MEKIPTGTSHDDIKKREEIISDFYRKWYDSHPSKRVYNGSLKDYINVRYLSITETVRHASKNYLSTLAVLQLDHVLRNSVKVGKPQKSIPGVKNQEVFSKLQIMQCNMPGIGNVKLTVGIKKNSGMKIQYCITAIRT